MTQTSNSVHWETNPILFQSTLFLHDGPLYIDASFHFRGIQRFIGYAAKGEITIHFCGIEESNTLMYPDYSDLVGLETILTAISELVTPIDDSTLYPIVSGNSLVSISPEPSGPLLKLFFRSLTSA